MTPTANHALNTLGQLPAPIGRSGYSAFGPGLTPQAPGPWGRIPENPLTDQALPTEDGSSDQPLLREPRRQDNLSEVPPSLHEMVFERTPTPLNQPFLTSFAGVTLWHGLG